MQQVAVPFIKWVGGKRQLLNKIREKYPTDLGGRINKYAEPFLGGGAVLFDILSNYKIDDVYVSDVNLELIHTYRTVRDNIDALIKIVFDFETEYILSGSSVARKKIYYAKRDRFNDLKLTHNLNVELAALFIFLNQTCFNGLYRVNSQGLFNVAHGDYSSHYICDYNNLRAVSHCLRNTRITHGDYKFSQYFIDDRTFVYLDPPYRPISKTANFKNYTQEEFGDKEQEELAHFYDNMSNRGASIVMSNSDPKNNTNESDNFFDDLYAKYQISRVSASRAVNSAGDKRGKVSELLISNF